MPFRLQALWSKKRRNKVATDIGRQLLIRWALIAFKCYQHTAASQWYWVLTISVRLDRQRRQHHLISARVLPWNACRIQLPIGRVCELVSLRVVSVCCEGLVLYARKTARGTLAYVRRVGFLSKCCPLGKGDWDSPESFRGEDRSSSFRHVLVTALGAIPACQTRSRVGHGFAGICGTGQWHGTVAEARACEVLFTALDAAGTSKQQINIRQASSHRLFIDLLHDILPVQKHMCQLAAKARPCRFASSNLNVLLTPSTLPFPQRAGMCPSMRNTSKWRRRASCISTRSLPPLHQPGSPGVAYVASQSIWLARVATPLNPSGILPQLLPNRKPCKAPSANRVTQNAKPGRYLRAIEHGGVCSA